MMGYTYIQVHDDLPDKIDIYEGCNNRICEHPFKADQIPHGFQEGDVLRFKFNFTKNNIKMYCNGKRFFKKSLKWCKNFTPAFMLDNDMEIGIDTRYT